MLTKQDLKQIGDVVNAKLVPVFEELGKLNYRVGNLELSANNRFDKIEERLDGIPTRDEILEFRDNFVTMYLKTRDEQARQLMLIRRNTGRIEKIEEKIA